MPDLVPDDEVFTRASRAVRVLCREMARRGGPPSREHVHQAVQQALVSETVENPKLQPLVLKYLQAARSSEELDDLYELAEEDGRESPVTGPCQQPETAPGTAFWPLCEALCEASRDEEDLPTAQELAGRAATLATALHGAARRRAAVSGLSTRATGNLLAYALAHQGHAFRRADELTRAGECFRQMHLAAMTTEGQLEWEDDLEGYCPYALYLEANFLRVVRRIRESVDRLALSLELLAGRTTHPPRPLFMAQILLSLAKALEDSGQPEPAIRLLELCRDTLGNRLRSDAKLWYCLHHNLCVSLALAERPAQARELLPKVQRLRNHHSIGEWGAHQLLWLEGHLLWLEGDRSGALAQLERARQAFITDGEAFDVALISLEMASHYVELGDQARVRLLVSEMLPIFAARGIDRETLAAIGFLSVTLAHDVEQLEALEQVRRFLRRARFDATQMFFPPD